MTYDFTAQFYSMLSNKTRNAVNRAFESDEWSNSTYMTHFMQGYMDFEKQGMEDMFIKTALKLSISNLDRLTIEKKIALGKDIDQITPKEIKAISLLIAERLDESNIKFFKDNNITMPSAAWEKEPEVDPYDFI